MISNQEILETLSGAVESRRGIALPASGRSMGPEFATARDIVVEPFIPSAVRVGSIIVFQRNERWIVHRVMWKLRAETGAFCITKGDSARQLDQPYVKASEIKGLVVGLNTNNHIAVDLTSRLRRLGGLAMVLRGWLIVGLFRLLRSRQPEGA